MPSPSRAQAALQLIQGRINHCSTCASLSYAYFHWLLSCLLQSEKKNCRVVYRKVLPPPRTTTCHCNASRVTKTKSQVSKSFLSVTFTHSTYIHVCARSLSTSQERARTAKVQLSQTQTQTTSVTSEAAQTTSKKHVTSRMTSLATFQLLSVLSMTRAWLT